MKKLLVLGFGLGLLSFSQVSQAWPVNAACVGGPKAPSYAFNNWGEAQQCANRISAFGGDCARLVRTGVCKTENFNVDATPAWNCQCNPNRPAIGYWK